MGTNQPHAALCQPRLAPAAWLFVHGFDTWSICKQYAWHPPISLMPYAPLAYNGKPQFTRHRLAARQTGLCAYSSVIESLDEQRLQLLALQRCLARLHSQIHPCHKRIGLLDGIILAKGDEINVLGYEKLSYIGSVKP